MNAPSPFRFFKTRLSSMRNSPLAPAIFGSPIIVLGTLFLGLTEGIIDAAAFLLVAGLFSFFALVPEKLATFGWFIPGWTFIVVLALTPKFRPSMEFFGATAQIAPVLFLALILEMSRIWGSNREMVGTRRAWRLPAAHSIFAVIAAGGFTLFVLATGEPTQAAFRVVVAGLATSAISLVLMPFIGRSD